MKKFAAFSLVLILLATNIYAKETDSMMNLVLDPSFEMGATIFGPAKPKTFMGYLRLSNTETIQPRWELTQWNSRFNIRRIKAEIINGEYIYQNEYKTVARTQDGTLTLRVNASEEYERVRKSKLDSWVHLYFEQHYMQPYSLKDAAKATLKLSFTIPEFLDKTPEGELDNTQHAVISVFYIILQDTNPASPSHGQYINFCVMLYDNRTGVTDESLFVDSGQNPIDATNMMIYTMDSRVYAKPVYADSEWHDIDVDLMPYFSRALEETQKRGLMQGSSIEDISISKIFFGFEVPGMMDCEMKIRDLFMGLQYRGEGQ